MTLTHLGVVVMAYLSQVLACGYPQPDGQSLAEQPQDCGPEKDPEELWMEKGHMVTWEGQFGVSVPETTLSYNWEADPSWYLCCQ